jgi:hypothetical protein
MNNWYSVSLGDGMMASVPSAEIEKQFQHRFTSGVLLPYLIFGIISPGV